MIAITTRTSISVNPEHGLRDMSLYTKDDESVGVTAARIDNTHRERMQGGTGRGAAISGMVNVPPRTMMVELCRRSVLDEPSRPGSRTAQIVRKTRETDIRLTLEIDGKGRAEVATGVGFLDHMLELYARHSLMDLSVAGQG